MSKKELKVKQELNLDQTVQHLEKLIKSIKEKKVVITKEDQYIVLEPEKTLKFKLSAQEEKNEQSLKIEMSWSNIKPVDENSGAVFVISSNEPVIKKEEPKSEEPKADAHAAKSSIPADNPQQAAPGKPEAKGNVKK